MADPSRQLTIDEAIAELEAMVQDELGDAPPGGGGRQATPEDAETRRFRMAQHLIGLACPAPAGCHDYHCRRDAACRHLVRARAKWRARKSSHPRRSPGADALRHAIWLYASARRGGP